MSTARLVRDHVARMPVRSFVFSSELQAPPHAVDCEFARLVDRHELLRVRKGLYWKGPRTRAGIPAPRPMQVGLEVAGDGAGPAEFSAAAVLGLTSQVPSVEVVAVAGRPPTPPQGVQFVSRSVERRIRKLRFLEVAVIEVLRDGLRFAEAGLGERRGRSGANSRQKGEIRLPTIAEQIHDEHHSGTRARWQLLEEMLQR